MEICRNPHQSGPSQLICPCLEGCVRINKEIGKRGRIESGGHPGTTEICLTLISPHRLYVPQSRKEGEGKSLLYQDTKNKVVTFLKSKTSSNHTLGQNILSYNLEGARIGLNSLTFTQGENRSTSVNSHIFPF